MSCNGGGDSGAMNAIEWLMTGQGYTRSESRLTGRTKTSAVQFDMNFDGVFDENDVSPYGILQIDNIPLEEIEEVFSSDKTYNEQCSTMTSPAPPETPLV